MNKKEAPEFKQNFIAKFLLESHDKIQKVEQEKKVLEKI